MDTIDIIVQITLLIIVLLIVGFGIYIIYDYITYKKTLDTALKVTTTDINSNFRISSSNVDTIYDATQTNIVDIAKNTSLIKDLSLYSSNTSNLISNRITNTDATFLNLNNNLNRYFSFNDGTSNISSNDNNPNNKIFNYIFGTSVPNMNLMTKTTAFSGITMNTDINKELLICNSNITNKCIKMSTDTNGNFNIMPAGANNITFNNNRGHNMLNIDTLNNSMYLGGSNIGTSAMYVKDNNVYIKNLNIVDDTATVWGGNAINSANLTSLSTTILNRISTTLNKLLDTTTIIENKQSTTPESSIIISVSFKNIQNNINIVNAYIFTIDIKNMLKTSLITTSYIKTYGATLPQDTTKYLNYYFEGIGENNNIVLNNNDLNNNILSFTINPSNVGQPPFIITNAMTFNIRMRSNDANLTNLPNTFSGVIQGYSSINPV